MVLKKTAAALATGVLATGAAVVGVGTLTHADAATKASTAASTSTTKLHCGTGLKKLPTKLKTDIQAARKLPAGQRGPALRTIRLKALHGDYGTTAQKWAVHRIRVQARVAAHEPKALRQELRKVHKLPAAQRQAARAAIEKKVLAGGYGAKAQKHAEKVKAHRAACKAQRA